ncbi:hypothetical protein HPP92_007939 [Vanilla planifolia]|uniref:Uncharacterized protein n=1 Tax=Vanilla planifolia TaxID=51239 RepID=A0A835RF63_VANPL|nr:hypothetical protein HPP92_007939 [Vanilla planifolia]
MRVALVGWDDREDEVVNCRRQGWSTVSGGERSVGGEGIDSACTPPRLNPATVYASCLRMPMLERARARDRSSPSRQREHRCLANNHPRPPVRALPTSPPLVARRGKTTRTKLPNERVEPYGHNTLSSFWLSPL